MGEIREIKGKTSEDYEDLLNSMFSKSELQSDSEVIELPSRGKFYDTVGNVTVSPLTFEDETRILGSKGKGSDLINLILKNCVQGVSIPDLVLMDKLYLLMKVREVSYGTTYKFDIICPACTTHIKSEIDLEKDLNVNYVDKNFKDPRKIKLPKSKLTVSVRFPRSREEAYFQTPEMLANNLYRFVTSIEDNDSALLIAKAIKRMHIIDVKTIANEVTRGEFGLDPRFKFECPSCGHAAMMEMPLDASFFSVT